MTLSIKFSMHVDDTCYLSIHNFVQMGAVHTRSFNWLIQPVNVAFHEAFTENARVTAPARNRHFGPLSALRAYRKAPYKYDLLRETLRALNRRGRARTVEDEDAAAGVLVVRPLDGPVLLLAGIVPQLDPGRA